MKATRFFKFRAVAKKRALCILTATGFAGLTIQAATTKSNLIPFSDYESIDKIRAGFDGVVRSSRAIYTVAVNVVDYKYSLHDVSLDSDEYRRKLSEVHLRSAKRILKLCEINKGFYVKAGQFVAAIRQVPKEYSSILSSLQDQATPCHFNAIKQVFASNLSDDWLDLFLSFDEKPIAAASIAQVHHAVLKDHKEVAIKVQYPGLEYQMKIDIITMAFLSNSISWIFPEYRFEWMVSEFEKAISLELDFIQEAKNSERTAVNFKNNSMVHVPYVLWDLTTSKVLIMEYCSGFKVDDVRSLEKYKIDPVKVAKALVEVFAEMIFVHGFLHGDPHPGNILVSPKGQNGFSLVLLDHGVYKELNKEFRLEYCQLWKALILQDAQQIEIIGEKFGVGKYSRYFPVIFTGRTINSKAALGRGMSPEEKRNLKQELKTLRMDDISSFMESLPSDFLTILRTDGLLRSIVSKLGAEQRIRLLAYAKYATYGLSSKMEHRSDLAVISMIPRFKAILSYLQLRLFVATLELLYSVGDFHHSLVRKLKMMFAKIEKNIVHLKNKEKKDS